MPNKRAADLTINVKMNLVGMLGHLLVRFGLWLIKHGSSFKVVK
jgi:hypothetical protein